MEIQCPCTSFVYLLVSLLRTLDFRKYLAKLPLLDSQLQLVLKFALIYWSNRDYTLVLCAGMLAVEFHCCYNYIVTGRKVPDDWLDCLQTSYSGKYQVMFLLISRFHQYLLLLGAFLIYTFKCPLLLYFLFFSLQRLSESDQSYAVRDFHALWQLHWRFCSFVNFATLFSLYSTPACNSSLSFIALFGPYPPDLEPIYLRVTTLTLLPLSQLLPR